MGTDMSNANIIKICKYLFEVDPDTEGKTALGSRVEEALNQENHNKRQKSKKFDVQGGNFQVVFHQVPKPNVMTMFMHLKYIKVVFGKCALQNHSAGDVTFEEFLVDLVAKNPGV